jgi:hypothetical protein
VRLPRFAFSPGIVKVILLPLIDFAIRRQPPSVLLASLVLVGFLASAPPASAQPQSSSSTGLDTSRLIAADVSLIKQVGPNAAGHDEAIKAAERLAKQDPAATTAVLAAMKDATPLGKNWLRVIAADIADNQTFPKQVLLDFYADRSQDTDARHAAYQMLVASEPDLKASLLEGAADDPSLPIRHLAMASLLDQANALKESDKTAAEKLYRTIVAQGRNPDQLQAATKALNDLGQSVVLADELGLIRRWWAIGTFDNTGSAHFSTVYLPEQTYLKEGRLPDDWLKQDATVVPAAGSQAAAKSQLVSSDDFQGVVNINPTFENAKDAVAYCYVEFDLPADAPAANAIAAVAKIGCITASKVWVNGKFVMANEVYHSGSRIDQYVGDCELTPGRNSVLIKICQNAQTEPWAQDWQFQFRFTDPVGAAIKPKQIVAPKP